MRDTRIPKLWPALAAGVWLAASGPAASAQPGKPPGRNPQMDQACASECKPKKRDALGYERCLMECQESFRAAQPAIVPGDAARKK